MLKKFAVVLIVLGACSVASAGPFSYFDSNGNMVYGNTWNGGGSAFNNYGQSAVWNGNFRPSFQAFPNYGYRPYYRAPVMNDYYRQSPYQGYGFKSW